MLFCFFSSTANASRDLSTAYGLSKACAIGEGNNLAVDGADFVDAGYCIGFFSAIIDYGMFHEEMNSFYSNENTKSTAFRPLFCAPDKVTSGQASKIFIKYIDENPQKLHEPAFVIAIISLAKAFPCETDD